MQEAGLMPEKVTYITTIQRHYMEADFHWCLVIEQ